MYSGGMERSSDRQPRTSPSPGFWKHSPGSLPNARRLLPLFSGGAEDEGTQEAVETAPKAKPRALSTHTHHMCRHSGWTVCGAHLAPHERGLAQAQGSLVAIRDTWASWLPARPLGFRVNS